mmetsp:Transcript_23275/g.55397  ORF Transcript_23275/g.55397 Transcript_23275/m.55397 type:complete len:570 (-) Transcript_23275:102-1811(-)
MSRFVEHFRAIVGHTSEKKLQEAAAKKKEEKSKAAKIMANKKGHSTTLPHIQRSEFQVGSMIGQGSFATVHKAKHIPTGRDVAIKVVRPESELDFGTGPNGSSPGVCYDDVLKAMKLEVKIVETLGKHPYLVELLGTADDCKVFVMERAASDLYTIVKKQGSELPLNLAAEWAQQLLTATVYMHEMGVVHQDIKSSNVLVFPDRTAKMCDFGLAREAAKVMCVDRELITLWYRAPELLMGESVYTEKVDEWGVGTILLEMMIGHSPFRGKPECFCSCPQISHRNYNSDQLMKVFAMCGTPRERTFLARMACSCHFSKWPYFPRKLEATVTKVISESRCANWVPGKPHGEEETNAIAEEWCELIAGLLHLDPEKRLDAQTALDLALTWSDSRPRGPKSPKTPVEKTPSPPAIRAAAKQGSHGRRTSLSSEGSVEANQSQIRRAASHHTATDAKARTLSRRGSDTTDLSKASGAGAKAYSGHLERRSSLPAQVQSQARGTVHYAAPLRRSSVESGEEHQRAGLRRQPSKAAATPSERRRASIKDLAPEDKGVAGGGLLQRTCSAKDKDEQG